MLLLVCLFDFFAEEKPSLLVLEDFTLKSGERINILEKVGEEFIRFGTHLLLDEEGTTMATIKSDCLGRAADIKMEIIRRWRRGQGKSPISWATLIDVLKICKFNALAIEVEEALIHNAGGEE